MATDSAALNEPAGTDAESNADGQTPPISVDEIGGLADADDSEAAAVAVAIAAHLRDRQAAAAAVAEADDGQSRRSWAFAGRLAAIGEEAGRPPNETATDGWTAASRADRF